MRRECWRFLDDVKWFQCTWQLEFAVYQCLINDHKQSLNFYGTLYMGVTSTIQYNIYTIKCKRLLYLWPCFGFQTVSWLFLGIKCFGFLSLVALEQKSGTPPGVREKRVTKFWRRSSEFQIWRVEAFWFPRVKTCERRKSDRQTKTHCADTQPDNNSGRAHFNAHNATGKVLLIFNTLSTS